MAINRVSNIVRFVEGYRQGLWYIGIDVHKKSWSVALLRPDGEILTFVRSPGVAGFIRELKRLEIAIGKICYEAGPTGFWLVRGMKKAGFHVILAAPSRIPRQVSPGAKTDRLDCRKLANFAKTGLLRSIAIPSEEEEAFRGLVRRRNRTVDSLRKTKQRIRSLLLLLGITEPDGIDSWSKKAVETLSLLKLDPAARDILDSLVRELDFINGELRLLRERMEFHASKVCGEERMKRLRSQEGVGVVVSTAFAAEIFHPERFQNSGQVTSYLGLAPMVRQSGEQKGRGKLPPVGQQRLRSLLIEAAWGWIGKDTSARDYYRRILGQTGLSQKAIVAVARKLAVRLWYRSIGVPLAAKVA